ncbi:AAA family ATPase [Agromyces sp. MMS24-JH15]|uniref:helix-turn-helix transcriptional regulator n=1 Tax=Agromyces sp. MMS24-JH15 TaxID=3243765 RepID=UPI00374A9030
MTTTAVSPAMVGRQADLSWLEGLLSETRDGAPRTVVLGGEAGIGKTRLLREFRARLDPDVRYLAGQCVDLGSVASPYAPVKTALRALVAEIGAEAALEAVGPGRTALTALLPELGPSDGDAASTTPDGAAAAGRLHEAIAVLLESASRERATVLVVEDLHWVDAASLALLRFLMRALTEARVLLVMTYRTEDVGRGHPLRGFLSEVERDRWVDRRELSRLTRAQTVKMARALITEVAAEEAIESIARRSEGVPFFIEELVGIDGCRDEEPLPDTLRDLLLARYERLSDGAQELLRLIATGGVRISHGLLAEVHAGDAAAIDAGAREAVIGGVLTIDGDDYAFRHALVREAILADLLPGERARFHARYAEAYERSAGRRRVAAEISFHWLGAHDAVRAYPATIQAMREARASAAFATAAQLGERALSLWDVVPDAEALGGMGKVELMGRTGAYLRNAGESERALALVKAALAECPADDPQVARLLRDQAFVLANLARPGAVALLRRSLELLPEDALLQRATVLTGLAGRLMIDGAGEESIRVADEAAAVADRIDSDRYRSIATNIAAVSIAERGDVERGLAQLELAREYADGDGPALLRYFVNASDLRHLIGDFRAALRLAEEGFERAREEGLERSSGVILASNAIDPLMALGEWEQADRLIERSLSLVPSTSFEMYVQRARIWAILWRGDVAGATAALRAARSGLNAVMDVELQARLGVGRVLAELALESDDLPGAVRELGRLFAEQHVPHAGYALPYLWAASRVIAAARRDPAAAELGADEVADREARLRSLLDAAQWPTRTTWVPVFEAELAAADDVAAWEAAVEAADRPDSPVVLRSHTRLGLARAHLAAGDRVAARAAVESAIAVADLTGIGLVRAHAEAFARSAGLAALHAAGTAHADGEEYDPLEDLTARERQVLDLIAEGLSNRQIGERLFISGKTASVHVSAILRKLGASTRTEAAVRVGALR